MTHYTTLVQRCRSTNSLLADEIAAEFQRLERAVENERERCAGIVGLARFGEIDMDFRSIINRIECGQTLDEIKRECES